MDHNIPDRHQNFWELASIQLAGFTSLPMIATSILLLSKYNFISALITLILGNFVLFGIRYVFVKMIGGERKSTLDLARDYVGYSGGYVVAVLLLLSTVAWFVTQTTLASNSLEFLVPIREGANISEYIQIAAFLGIVSTLLCMEGIVVLKWISVIVFPITIICLFGIFFAAPPANFPIEYTGISLSGLPFVIGTSLGVTADLPTFFRHSRSKKDSFYALVAIQIVSLVLSITALYLVNIVKPWFGIQENNSAILSNFTLRTLLLIHIFVSTIAANVANVYSASVAWELIAPKLAGRKEYLILGLGLTTIFILITNIFSLDVLVDVTDGGLVNLSIILLIAFFIKILSKRSPDFWDKVFYFAAWFLSSLINILQRSELIFTGQNAFLLGVISMICVLIVTSGIRFNLSYFSMKNHTPIE